MGAEKQELETGFLKAVVKGDEVNVRDGMAQGVDPNCQNRNGNPALCLAIGNLRFKIARLLLSKGADPTQADSMGRLPLYHAAKNFRQDGDGADQLFSQLLELTKEFDCRDPQGHTALFAALEARNIKGALALIKLGARVNLIDMGGVSVVGLAAECGDVELLRQVFLAFSSDKQIPKYFVDIGLIHAVENGDYRCVEFMLKDVRADPNAKDAAKIFTAIQYAVGFCEQAGKFLPGSDRFKSVALWVSCGANTKFWGRDPQDLDDEVDLSDRNVRSIDLVKSIPYCKPAIDVGISCALKSQKAPKTFEALDLPYFSLNGEVVPKSSSEASRDNSNMQK